MTGGLAAGHDVKCAFDGVCGRLLLVERRPSFPRPELACSIGAQETRLCGVRTGFFVLGMAAATAAVVVGSSSGAADRQINQRSIGNVPLGLTRTG